MKKIKWLIIPLFAFVTTFGASCGNGTEEICSDGIVNADEQCDDANLNNGDGCSETCTLEEETKSFSDSVDLPLADNGYDGTIDSMTCVSLNVPDDDYNSVTGVELTVGMDHSWVGDVVIKVVSPKGTIVTVLNQPGIVEPADDGLNDDNPSLVSSNLSSTSPITFKNGGSTDAEEMGNTLSNDQIVCQDDGLCNYAPNAGAASPSGDFSLFNGQNSVGIWKACVGDSQIDSDGTLKTVELKIKKQFSL